MSPYAPLRPCSYPRCPALIGRPDDGSYRGRCRKHAQQHEQDRNRYEARRTNYHTAAWRKESKAKLDADPMCLACGLDGRLTPSTVVDHVVEHTSEATFWDRTNWATVCASHHASKGNAEQRRGGTFDLPRYIAAHRAGLTGALAWEAFQRARAGGNGSRSLAGTNPPEPARRALRDLALSVSRVKGVRRG